MAITRIHADKVMIPFQRPFATSTGMWLAREAWIIRLVDADGRVGAGEAVVEPQDGAAASSVLDHLVRDLERSGRADGLPSAAELDLHGSPGRALRAAIDAARFDLGLLDGVMGSTGRPWPGEGDGLALDGHPDDADDDEDDESGLDGVGVNATLPSIGPSASAEAARQSVSAGFRTLKLKAGAERETQVLVDRVRAVREAVGPDVRLRLDVNGAWDLETATDRLEALGRFALEYVEQPLAGDDPAAMAELRRRVRVPLAADETVTSVRAARLLLDAGAVDVLVVKPVRVGGLVAAAEVADLAADRGVPVVISTLFETGVGIAAGLALAAALPEVRGGGRLGHAPDHGLATAGLLEHDLLEEGLILDGGLLRTPGGERTGRLGIRVSERTLVRYSADRAVGPVWEAWDA
ncbi:MAG: mandelate racemase/muconate lactonizing enzyme family protein [Candidatus Limnocylindrales bacterium]